MTKETKNSRTTREEERLNEGGREFGRVHQPSQTEEASSRHGLADDVMPNPGNRQQAPNRNRQQAPGERREGVTGSHRGSGTRQSRPPGNAQRTQARPGQKKAA